MGNEVTTPIGSSRKQMTDELENERQKALNNRKKVSTPKQPSEKELKQANDRNTAMSVFAEATKNVKIENFTNFDDYRTACRNAFQVEVAKRAETEDKNDDLTEEQIKIAQKYMKSKEFKAAKQEIRFNNQNHIRSLQADVDGVTKAERKEQTDDILLHEYEAREEELRQQLRDEKISEDEYNDLRAANKQHYDDYRRDNRTTNGFKRFFGAKETGADRIHSVGAKQATLETTRKFMTSGEEGAVESRINPELMGKINRAGYSIDDLYSIYDKNSGTDATVNYSYKKKQPGERDQLLGSLNEKVPEGAEQFTMSDVKELGRALGYNVEKAVDAGQVFTDIGRTSPLSVAGGFANLSAKSTAVAGTEIAKTSSTVPLGAAIAPAVTIGTAVASAYKQYTRVEDRAIPTNVPIDSQASLEAYNKYLDNEATPEGARLGKAIAKYYVNPHTDEFDFAQLNEALRSASGTVNVTGTPCNYEEAEALLTGLKSGKIKPRFIDPQPKPAPVQPVYEVTNTPVDDEREIQTHDYTVKRWDDWNTVLSKKYPCADPKKVVRYFKKKYFDAMSDDEKRAKGITSERDGFFYPVGYIWKLPEYIVIDGKRCEYTENEVPQNRRSNGSVRTITQGASFTEKYQRDSWNGFDVTDESVRRRVADGQPTRTAAESKIHEDAARRYPDAEVTIR